MTENANWSEEYPAHDLWSIEKNFTPMSPEEEFEAWRTTVKVLEGFCAVADGLVLDPLILAFADCITRCREELARVEDRLSRPAMQTESAKELTPREHERLKGLLRRSDAFGTASWLIRKYAAKCGHGEVIQSEVAIVEAASAEANEQFELYRDEVGIPNPCREDRGADRRDPPA